MWFGISDGALVPLAMPPVQFHDVWSRSKFVSPERGLALAIMEQAVNDLANNRFAGRRRGQRVYWEAYNWVAAEARDWSFSFVNLCDGLGLDVESTRRCILDATTVLTNVASARFEVSRLKLGKAA